MKKRNMIIILIAVLLFIGLLCFLVYKWNDFILPYNNVDKAAEDLLNVDTITDYKLIKHYSNITASHLGLFKKPIFIVDIEYSKDIYESNKEKELTNRNIYKEEEILDYKVIVVSKLNEPIECICFCDELNTIRYIKLFNKTFNKVEETSSFEYEILISSYYSGCKWSLEEVNINQEEVMPEKILWQKSSE